MTNKETPQQPGRKAKPRRAESLNVGETFRLPSTNSHDADGFRRYTVIARTADGVRVQDVHGYVSNLRFGSLDAKQALATAIFEGATTPAAEVAAHDERERPAGTGR